MFKKMKLVPLVLGICQAMSLVMACYRLKPLSWLLLLIIVIYLSILTPDAPLSYDERSRLYHLERSSWQDYNKALISTGGGVFSRAR